MNPTVSSAAWMAMAHTQPSTPNTTTSTKATVRMTATTT